MGRSREGEAQQEEDEDACLQAVGGHTVRREEDGAHELALAGFESGAEGHCKATTVGSPEEVVGAVGAVD